MVTDLTIVVGVTGVTLAVLHVLSQYVLPVPGVTELAKLANVPRRHLESARRWGQRVDAAIDTRGRANDMFLAAAQVSGTAEYHGRAILYRLPRNHPASVALLHAKYPDGPSLEELRELAGLGKDSARE